MKTSESIIKIAPAFLKAQKKIEHAIKDGMNPHFKSKFASHEAVIDACKKQLNDEGIAILQPPDGMSIETILIHESGEWFSSLTPIVCKEENNPQALGSAITYAKRYGLQSMVLLPAEDDDGNAATKQTPEQKAADDVAKFTESQRHCSDCPNDGLIDRVIDFSLSKYGRVLCYKCQKEEDKKSATVTH